MLLTLNPKCGKQSCNFSSTAYFLLYLFTLLFNGRSNNFLQIFPGLFHPLVDELPFALSRFQLALKHGNLIWRQLVPVLIQKLLSTCDDLI